MAVFGGIAQVRDNVLTILANDAQWPEDIDRATAEKEHDLAAQHIQESPGLLEIQKEQVKLRRTLVQIEVSSYPLISKISHGEEDNFQENEES
jgi:F-type H+-transporting ATPase subunit epsilon